MTTKQAKRVTFTRARIILCLMALKYLQSVGGSARVHTQSRCAVFKTSSHGIRRLRSLFSRRRTGDAASTCI